MTMMRKPALLHPRRRKLHQERRTRKKDLGDFVRKLQGRSLKSCIERQLRGMLHQVLHKGNKSDGAARMFVIDRTRGGTDELPEETIDMAGTTGNIYNITIGQVPSCTCPDHQKGNQCKHIVYVSSCWTTNCHFTGLITIHRFCATC